MFLNHEGSGFSGPMVLLSGHQNTDALADIMIRNGFEFPHFELRTRYYTREKQRILSTRVSVFDGPSDMLFEYERPLKEEKKGKEKS